MIIIGEKAYLKAYEKKQTQELDTYNNINKIVKAENDQIQSNKVTRKESKTSNNDMYNNIKNKASILYKDKRNIQEKVKINKIQKQVNELNNDYTIEVTELKELEYIIQTISIALNKINETKNKIEQYKTKLINLENLVQKSKKKLDIEQNKIETNIDENVISNPLDFISISGDINTEIIIDIKI